MGIGTSHAICGINRRTLLNVDNANEIIKSCSKNRFAYIWGILFTITVVLYIGHVNTKEYEDETDFPRKHFYVPLWIVPLPSILGLLYTLSTLNYDAKVFAAEQMEFQLSQMPKKEYLQYRVGDDRANTSFLGTATSAGILSGTSLLGPFLRADR